MHDLVHDLAESVLKSESINLETGVLVNNYRIRYLAVNSSRESTAKPFENMSTSLRTLFLKNPISDGMLSKLKNLHVLNLSGVEIRELPNTIGKLIHLRYIDLSESRIQTLPESLCKLYNLQTLRISQCQALKYLPKGMSNLISLRHLHYYKDDANFQMPMEMGRLTCLQTLEFFNVGQEKGRQIEEVGFLKDLKGKMVIHNLELVNGKEGAEQAKFFEKANLFGLEFEWGSRNREGKYCDEDVLEGLQPHPNLEELVIKSYAGDQFPGWFMNLSTRLHKLVRLSLRDCKRCRELPAIGQLPFLQDLELIGLENIRCIGLSVYGIDHHFSNCEVPRKLFPALKTLSLRNMGNLVEWMEAEVRSSTTAMDEAEVDAFPVLESLSIEYCSQLTTTPSHFPSLKKLEIKRNDHVLVAKNILSKVTTTLCSLRIEGMAGLTCVSDVAPAGLHHSFQNLKHLYLVKCPDLTSTRGCGTSLESLYLSDCDNLKEFPEDPFGFQSLRSLSIRGCRRIVFPNEGIQNLVSLQDLTVARCDGLTNLPGELLESCKHLQGLRVYECPNLVSFPLDFQRTPSLFMVWLYKCPKLMTNMMPKGFGFLLSLRELFIGPFSSDSSVNEFDWSGLISSSTLRNLELYGLPHMESLPNQLQYLTTLTDLRLIDFGIEALPNWIGNFEFLEKLCLWDCQNLRHLPSINAMRRLTNLRYLQAFHCPLLKERCTPQSGPDSEWSKISHIPDLDFG